MVQLTTLCVHILLCNGISTMKRQDAASEYQQPSKSPRISAAKSKPGMRALGNAVYRSTLPPHKGAVLDLHQQLLPKVARVQAVIRCGAVQPTQWRLTGSRGENWLLNPGHVMGLHAVVERLCFYCSCGGASCIIARELVQTFVTARERHCTRARASSQLRVAQRGNGDSTWPRLAIPPLLGTGLREGDRVRS